MNFNMVQIIKDLILINCFNRDDSDAFEKQLLKTLEWSNGETQS